MLIENRELFNDMCYLIIAKRSNKHIEIFDKYILNSKYFIEIIEKEELSRNESKLLTFVTLKNKDSVIESIEKFIFNSDNYKNIIDNIFNIINNHMLKSDIVESLIKNSNIDNEKRLYILKYYKIIKPEQFISNLKDINNFLNDLNNNESYLATSILAAKFVITLKNYNIKFKFDNYEDIRKYNSYLADIIAINSLSLKMLDKDFRNRYNESGYKFSDYRSLPLSLELNKGPLKPYMKELVELYKKYSEYYKNIIYPTITEEYGDKGIFEYLKRHKNRKEYNRDYNEWIFKDIIRERNIKKILSKVIKRSMKNRENNISIDL